MPNMPPYYLFPHLLGAIAIIIGSSDARAMTAEERLSLNQKGLSIIESFAEQACPLPLEAQKRGADVEASVDAKLSETLRKLADVNARVAAKYSQESEKRALIEEAVLPALQNRSECFQKIVDRLSPIFLIRELPPDRQPVPGRQPPSSPPLPDLRGKTFRKPNASAVTLTVSNVPNCVERETFNEAIQFDPSPGIRELSATRYIYQQSLRCTASGTCFAKNSDGTQPMTGEDLERRMQHLPTCLVEVAQQTKTTHILISSSHKYSENVVTSPVPFYYSSASVVDENGGTVEIYDQNRMLRFNGARIYVKSDN